MEVVKRIYPPCSSGSVIMFHSPLSSLYSTLFLVNYINLVNWYFCTVLYLYYALKDKYLQHINTINITQKSKGMVIT